MRKRLTRRERDILTLALIRYQHGLREEYGRRLELFTKVGKRKIQEELSVLGQIEALLVDDEAVVELVVDEEQP
jgi:hypothetical protein